MANLGQFTISANSNYQKVSDLTNITFEDGKTYLFQIQNIAIISSSATTPTEDGFLINNTDINAYTKQAGEDLYIKAPYSDIVISISD